MDYISMTFQWLMSIQRKSKVRLCSRFIDSKKNFLHDKCSLPPSTFLNFDSEWEWHFECQRIRQKNHMNRFSTWHLNRTNFNFNLGRTLKRFSKENEHNNVVTRSEGYLKYDSHERYEVKTYLRSKRYTNIENYINIQK